MKKMFFLSLFLLACLFSTGTASAATASIGFVQEGDSILQTKIIMGSAGHNGPESLESNANAWFKAKAEGDTIVRVVAVLTGQSGDGRGNQSYTMTIFYYESPKPEHQRKQKTQK